MEAATRRVDVKENGKMQTIHYHMLYVIYYYNMSIYSWTALHSSPLTYIFKNVHYIFSLVRDVGSFWVSLGCYNIAQQLLGRFLWSLELWTPLK